VIQFIEKYIDWKTKNAADKTSHAFSILPPLKSYWENLLDIFKNGFENRPNFPPSSRGDNNEVAGLANEDLQYGFWPCTDHGTGYKENLEQETPGDVHPLEEEQDHDNCIVANI
jgi:hypothetical protein